MLQANDIDRVWQNAVWLSGQVVSQGREMLRDLFIEFSLAAQVQDDLFHLGGYGEVSDGIGGNGNLQSRGSTPAPDNLGLHAAWGQAMDNDLVDQTTQEGFFVLLRYHALMPDAGKPLADSHKRFFQFNWGANDV